MFTIHTLELAVAEIFEQLWPGPLAAANENAVSMLYRLARKDRHMRPAQHHGDAASAKLFSQRVSWAGAARDRAYAHQISRPVHRDRIHTAICQSDFHIRRDHCSQSRQRQRSLTHGPDK